MAFAPSFVGAIRESLLLKHGYNGVATFREQNMDVKSAVCLALEYARDIFEPEKVTNLGLEEVEFDDTSNRWNITVGFSRPWDYPENTMPVLRVDRDRIPKRSYKIVQIEDSTQEIIAIRNREVNVCKDSALR